MNRLKKETQNSIFHTQNRATPASKHQKVQKMLILGPKFCKRDFPSQKSLEKVNSRDIFCRDK